MEHTTCTSKKTIGSLVLQKQNYDGDASDLNQTTKDEINDTKDHIAQGDDPVAPPEVILRSNVLNDSINILQDTNNMSEVKMTFTKDVGDDFYRHMYDAQQNLPINDLDFMVEKGKDVYRLDDKYNT